MVHLLIHYSLATNEQIDQEHLMLYPYCGMMPKQDDSSGASSRVVNSKDSEKRYPWVLFVRRKNLRNTKSVLPKKGSMCAASIITSMYFIMLNNAPLCLNAEHIVNYVKTTIFLNVYFFYKARHNRPTLCMFKRKT